MSAFLGDIHYWLYNKIQVEETMVESILGLAKSKGYDADSLMEQSSNKFGTRVTGALEDEITHNNIHGWLQERITSVESRLAFTTTTLLNEKVVTLEEIVEVFEKNAIENAKNVDVEPTRPSEVFTLVYNSLLAGMPCDRVNVVEADSQELICWVQAIDIHKEHWDKVGGDVENFKACIDKWISSFVTAISPKFVYKLEGEKNIIERV